MLEDKYLSLAVKKCQELDQKADILRLPYLPSDVDSMEIRYDHFEEDMAKKDKAIHQFHDHLRETGEDLIRELRGLCLEFSDKQEEHWKRAEREKHKDAKRARTYVETFIKQLYAEGMGWLP